MIALNDIRKTYYTGEVETPVLKGISFNVEPGEFVAIKGPSGSGKSTLMHIMSLLDRPTRGTYNFEDKDVSSFSDEKLAQMRNKKMGFVFQSFFLMRRISVFENVRLPLLYSKRGLTRRKERKIVKKVVDQVGLSHRIDYQPNQLSGGEKQRVAIARALVNNPSIVFADEPTGNLDSKTGKTIMVLLQKLNDQGHTIIMVTHEKYTSRHAERIISLKDGKVIQDKDVKERLIAKNHDSLLK